MKGSNDPSPKRTSVPRKSNLRKRLLIGALWITGILAIAGGSAAWLGNRASTLNSELTAANQLLPKLKGEITGNDAAAAAETLESLIEHTSKAREAGNDPLWVAAGEVPWLGSNFSATRTVATAADDVAILALKPLVDVYTSLSWEDLLPNRDGIDLGPLEAASPKVSSAAHAVRLSNDRLNHLDASTLVPQVADPLTRVRSQLAELAGGLDAAASVAQIAPDMLGSTTPRSYLLMIQNNAEVRASGGIPGALAVLNLDNGKLTLDSQGSATDVGTMNPPVTVDSEQQHIYSSRMGKFMQDVNLTPDFPTAASTAREIWERKYGQRLDGVVSIDPIALSYILGATGPVGITQPDIIALAGDELPTELTEQNVVKTLLSDVYEEIPQPSLQDAYFAAVARDIFGELSSGNNETTDVLTALTKGTQEGRVLVWSGWPEEQSLIAPYFLSGSVAGPSVEPAQFGVYFNDGTGAKMDYHVKRTVQLVKECTQNGYAQTTVRVTSTNTAPVDAATSLPAYVTGGGAYGVPAGSVQTNIVAYGPVQANVETAKVDGEKTSFAPYMHSNRPVGVLAIRLAPGESNTVDFTFGKIVQHSEPNVVVTPSVQNVKDVILPTEIASCGE